MFPSFLASSKRILDGTKQLPFAQFGVDYTLDDYLIANGATAGQQYRIYVPTVASNGKGIMYWHGLGSNTWIAGQDAPVPWNCISLLIRNGFTVGVSEGGGGSNYGNQACIDANINLYVRMIFLPYGFGSMGMFAQSNGGLGALNFINPNQLGGQPAIKGIYAIYGQMNLTHIWNNGGKPAIRVAYGLASDGSQDSNFATIAASFDPNLALVGADFVNLKMRYSHGPGDTVVPMSANAVLIQATASGHAIENDLIQPTSVFGQPMEHGGLGYFYPEDVLGWANRL